MSFSFISGGDEYMNLQGLINKNKAMFKSEKQAKFWISRIKRDINLKIKNAESHQERQFIKDPLPDPWNISVFGKQIPYGTYLIQANASTHFGKQYNQIQYAFVIDAQGIVAKYKRVNGKPAMKEFTADREIVSIKDILDAAFAERVRLNQLKIQELAEQGIIIPQDERVEVEGEIIDVKLSPSVYDRKRYEMTVECNGFLTTGTVPKKFHKIAEDHQMTVTDFIGATVTFVGKIHAGTYDVTFTYFSRPSKFKIDDDFLAMAILGKAF